MKKFVKPKNCVVVTQPQMGCLKSCTDHRNEFGQPPVAVLEKKVERISSKFHRLKINGAKIPNKYWMIFFVFIRGVRVRTLHS